MSAYGIDLESLSDRHLESLVRVYYAAAGEGAVDEGVDLDVCQAVAQELRERRLSVDLPWGHGNVDADYWLRDIQCKAAGGW